METLHNTYDAMERLLTISILRYGLDMYNTSLPTHIRHHGMIDNLTMTYDGNRLKKVTYQRDGSFGLFSMHWYIGAVSKHAEGMSLRCDAICALAYCGRHESSHIIKVHTDSARRLFVGICVNSWQKKTPI